MKQQKQISIIEKIMTMIATLAIGSMLTFGFINIGMAQTDAGADKGVTVTVKGESWDADSFGFSIWGALSKTKAEETSARRGSRISVDGQPDEFAIAGPGPGFELTFTTSEPTFRLIVDGDRFPRGITQSFDVPEGGGEVDVGRIFIMRAEGPEHTWPLPMTASALGYNTSLEMLADNKAAIRLLVYSSGDEGAPKLANDSTISVKSADEDTIAGTVSSESTNSPFLLRVVQSTYVIPYTMDPQDTFFQLTGPRLGAFVIIVSFAPGDPPDKDVIVEITDTVTETMLDPPRPWLYDPVVISVRNGFATDVFAHTKID